MTLFTRRCAFILLLAFSASAAELPQLRAEKVGVSTERLSRISGPPKQNLETGAPMTLRLYSMSRPITAVAVMNLREERKSQLPHRRTHPYRRMPDGKQWTTENLNVSTPESYCYGGAEANCRRYGRLYTWDSAQRACQSLGDGWRLPTNDEWRRMAKHYGGVRGDSEDDGKAAFQALSIGGSSGFNALLGGGRAHADGQYARLEAHGFYWTASESDATAAWFYNFGRGARILNRHPDGEKQRAFSVRCVRD